MSTQSNASPILVCVQIPRELVKNKEAKQGRVWGQRQVLQLILISTKAREALA